MGAGTAVSSQLYGVTATIPSALPPRRHCSAAVALIAGYVPAWRATRVNPVLRG
jgi:ABC-type lipoprotein release transport system permease subunit